MEDLNGDQPRVQFGPEPNHVMPDAWVVPMLQYMFARHKRIFGDAMMAVALGQNGELYERTRPGRQPAK